MDWRIGVAIGDQVLDLRRAKLIETLRHEPADAAARREPRPRCARRSRQGLRHGSAQEAQFRDALVPQSRVELGLPCEIGDYTDFYIEHPPRHHGRQAVPPRQPAAAELQVGADRLPRPRLVDRRRPSPSTLPAAAGPDERGRTPRCRMLGAEPSGWTTSWSSASSSAGPTRSASRSRWTTAEDHVFGVALFNDWSARDIQAWEYQPLGPFLSKNFASTLSPWIVTLDALAPFRNAFGRPPATRQPLPYLDSAANREHGAFDIELEVWLQTDGDARGRPCRRPAQRARTSRRLLDRRRSWSRTTRSTAATCATATCSARARCRGRSPSKAARCWS